MGKQVGQKLAEWKDTFLVVGALLLFSYGIGSAVYRLYQETTIRDALKHRGATAEGMLTRKRNWKSRNTAWYKFQVGSDARDFRGQDDMSSYDYLYQEVGTPLTVYYLPDDPKVSRLSLEVPLEVYFDLLPAGLFVLGVVGIGFYARRQRPDEFPL